MGVLKVACSVFAYVHACVGLLACLGKAMGAMDTGNMEGMLNRGLGKLLRPDGKITGKRCLFDALV